MGGCQNDGPLLGPLNTRCRVILGTQNGTMILTTTHMYVHAYVYVQVHVYVFVYVHVNYVDVFLYV